MAKLNDAQLHLMRREAATANELWLVEICDLALAGNALARRECELAWERMGKS